MPIGVIDFFEVIDIQHQKPRRAFGARCTLQLTAQRLQNLAPVPDPRERIMGRLKTELQVCPDLVVLQSEDSITGSQTRLQFALIEGFGEIVIRSRLQAPDQVLLRVLSGCEKYVLVRSLVTFSNPAT